MPIRDFPLGTRTLEQPDALQLPPETYYLFSPTQEARSQHHTSWLAGQTEVKLCPIQDLGAGRATVEVEGTRFALGLSSPKSLRNLRDQFGKSPVYLDITSLGTHIWALIIKEFWQNLSHFWVMYLEPKSYLRTSDSDTLVGDAFDLSTPTEGVRFLPGFASLKNIPTDQSRYVPLLGFQGSRTEFMSEQVQPVRGRIHPVLALPGTRPEHPEYALIANEALLIEQQAWQSLSYVPATCRFSLFYTLRELGAVYPDDTFKIALLGPKPHCLGAVLFKILYSDRVELFYDYPKPNPQAVLGHGRLHLYDVSGMMAHLQTL